MTLGRSNSVTLTEFKSCINSKFESLPHRWFFRAVHFQATMSRPARLVVPGMPHHITARGSRKADVFRDDADRLFYLDLIRESCRRFLLRIWAYCLMTNHVHFIAVPERPDSIWRVFHRTNGAYSNQFNAKNGFVGHLWQERPFSCPLAESHLWNAIRYVESNPVRAGMVSTAADYRWSSARAHCDGEIDLLLDPSWSPLQAIPNWPEWLDGTNGLEFGRLIRDCTLTGRPCGDEEFVRSIGSLTGRDFSRKKPGPKPKSNQGQRIQLPKPQQV